MSTLCEAGDGPLDIGEWLATYFRKRPLVTAGYAGVVLMFPIAGVVLPALMGKVTDLLKDPNPPPGAWWPHARNLGLALFAILALSIAWFYLDSWLVADLMAQLRKRIYCEIMKAYSHNYRSVQVSSIISKAIVLPGAAMDLVRLWHNKIIPGAIILIAVIGLMVWIDRPNPWSVCGVLAAIAIMGVGFWASMHVCTDAVIAAEYRNDAVQEKIGDTFENLMHVYLADAAGPEVEKFQADLEEQNQEFQRARARGNHFVGVLKVMMAVLTFVTFYLLYRRYQRGYAEAQRTGAEPPISSGKMAGLVFVFMASTHTVYNTLDAWPRVVMKTAMMRKMQMFFNDLIGHARKLEPAGRLCDPTLPLLVYGANTTFAYPGKTAPALRVGPAPITLAKGDWVLVTGHIGSGKSTLAMLALGLYGYDDPGSVKIQGCEVKTMTRTQLARKITYVQQSPKLLNRTLMDNLKLGSQLDDREIRTAVERFKATIDAGQSEPFDWGWLDLDRMAGKGGGELSGGQRAMVCLMRAMLNNTDIVICDELTANMDPATKRAVITMIRGVARDRLLLYITHDETISRDIQFTKRITMTSGVPDLQ